MPARTGGYRQSLNLVVAALAGPYIRGGSMCLTDGRYPSSSKYKALDEASNIRFRAGPDTLSLELRRRWLIDRLGRILVRSVADMCVSSNRCSLLYYIVV